MSFLSSFKLTFNMNYIREGADMWLLHLSTKKQAVTLLNSKITWRARSSNKCQKEWIHIKYSEVFSYLLKAHATDDVIVEPDAEIMTLTNPLNKTSIKCAWSVRETFLICDQVYNEYLLMHNLIEWFHDHIHHSMRPLQASCEYATVPTQERFVTSLTSVKNTYRASKTVCP